LKENFYLNDWELLNFVNLTDIEKEIVRKWRNHEDVREWMYSDHIITHKEHVEFIQKLQKDNQNLYWLAKSKEEQYIGVIYLNRVDYKNKNAYLGIYINPDRKTSGTGSLLIDCLKKIAFDIQRLHTLKLEVIETNERAISFYEKNGFSEEGKLREVIFKDDKWCDVIIMGMINKDISRRETQYSQ
jgi:UDP-4-amino-4,6-dideoxy-N-acetyl-beta-L-altrosamine N-acetyltransferase